MNEIRALAAKAQWTYPFEPSAAFHAANRALLEVARLFPTYGAFRLVHSPQRPSLFIGGVRRSVSASEAEHRASYALAFEASGTGRASVFSDGKLFESFEWSGLTQFKRMSVALSYPSHLSLEASGDSALIRGISFYSDAAFADSDDVYVYGDEIGYRMSDARYVGDSFAAFAPCCASLASRQLRYPDEYRLDGDVIYLPVSRTGEYFIRYIRLPERICEDNADCELDIDARIHDLVSLRAAYYLYLLTDSDVADRCNAEYQRLLPAALVHVRRQPSSFGIRDTRGW